MKNIRKHIIAIAAVAAVIVADGCTKRDELTPVLPSKFTPDGSLNSVAAFNAAILNMNIGVRFEFFSDSAPLLTECVFTDAYVEGTTDKTTPAQDLNSRITPTSNNDSDDYNKINRYWYTWYAGIKDANVVISRIDNIAWPSAATRNGVLATAYFHRAYRYYRLVHQFGDVPAPFKEEQSVNTGYQTVSRTAILKQLKIDLEYAVANLTDGGDKGTVTKGAAAHLLCKVDLALGLFDDAIAAANTVINGPYKLMTSRFGIVASDATRNVIWDLHRPDNKSLPNNTEAIYNVIDRDNLVGATNLGSQVMRNCVPMWHNGSLLTPVKHIAGISDIVAAPGIISLTSAYGRGIGRVRQTAYATKYIWTDNTDLRHAPGNWVNMTDLVWNLPDMNTPGKANYDPAEYGQHLVQWTDADAKIPGKVFKNGPQDSIRAWFGWPHYKIFITWGGGDVAIDKNWNPPRGTNTDWYVFRLAETYLLRAEAYLWKGQNALAMADINMVRARAQAQLLTDASQVNIGTVLDERARELFWEEPRKTELTRIAYIYAQTGQPDYKGRTYNVANFSTSNFFYDRIMDKNDFYRNPNVITNSGNHFTISPYHVLWPIPQSDIDLNVTGHINQNKGYTGAASNVPALDKIP